jgi:hypothetical protein
MIEKEIALQNQEKYKPLIDSELWPLIKSYTDTMCNKSIHTHDQKMLLKDPKDVIKKALSAVIDKYCTEENYGI